MLRHSFNFGQNFRTITKQPNYQVNKILRMNTPIIQQKLPQNIITAMTEYNLYEKDVLLTLNQKLKRKFEGFQPFLNSKQTKHFDSFLHRLIYNYEEYISQFKMVEGKDFESPEELKFVGNQNLKLKNKEEEATELELLNNFVREYDSFFPNEEPFPPNKINFLWNFFTFLNHHKNEFDKIMMLEEESRYWKFRNAFRIAFDNFPECLNNDIENERKKDPEESPTKRKIIRFIIRYIHL